MLKKLTLVLVLLSLCYNSSFAVSGVPNINPSVCSYPPVKVFYATTTDTGFSADSTGVVFSPGLTNDTVYAWMIQYVSPSTPLTIVKKTLHAENLTANGSDVTYTTDIKSKFLPVGDPGPGYLGIYTVDLDGTFDRLNFPVLAANSSSSDSPKKVQLSSGSSSDQTFSYSPSNIWFQDGYFYVLYEKVDVNTFKDLTVLFQGIEPVNGTGKWSTPLSIVTPTNNDYGETTSRGGPGSNSSSARIVWKDSDAGILYQTLVNLTAGTIGTVTPPHSSLIPLPLNIILVVSSPQLMLMVLSIIRVIRPPAQLCTPGMHDITIQTPIPWSCLSPLLASTMNLALFSRSITLQDSFLWPCMHQRKISAM